MAKPKIGKVLAFGQRTTICPACRIHQHGSCWAHLSATRMRTVDFEDCPCGCHDIPGDPGLARVALEDMARHGLLVDYVLRRQAFDRSSYDLHAAAEEGRADG